MAFNITGELAALYVMKETVNLGRSVICYSNLIFIINLDITFIIMIAYYVACGANINRAPYLNKFFKA